MSRQKIIAGNWKMNKTPGEAVGLAQAIKAACAKAPKAKVVVCPPFTALAAVSAVVRGGAVALGAQNMHWEKSGAYTGEVSAAMLLDLGCSYVILGHSERRTYFGETDETVNRKVKAALAAGLIPIVCVGETLAQRKENQTDAVVSAQVVNGLAGLGADLGRIVVAYEPVWAIGTGLTATPAQAQAVHALIRGKLTELGGAALAQTIAIQYGGSMKPDNAPELLSQTDIDGGLIGGAALDAVSFMGIVNAA